ncbi:MAG: EthD family reductase [Acidimicrobiales bacterium]
MVKLTVLYGPPTDPAAFDKHYMETHVPLGEALPGLRRFEVSKVSGTPDGTPAPYHLQADLYFDDAAAVKAAFDSPEGHAAGADVANFATGGATMLVSDVVKES